MAQQQTRTLWLECPACGWDFDEVEGYARHLVACRVQRQQRQMVIRKLNRAFEYLKPRMVADSLHGILPNAEAQAGSILAALMVAVHSSFSQPGGCAASRPHEVKL